MILAPFELIQLPKFAKRQKHSIPVFPSDVHLFIGVSSNAISKLCLRPPQLLSAYAVAPGTQITAVLVAESKVIAYASLERGKCFLNLLNQDDPDLKGTSPKHKLEVPDEISALYQSPDGAQLAAVSKNCSEIRGYSKLDLSQLWVEREEDAGELIFSSIVESASTSMGSFMVLFQGKERLRYRILALDSRNLLSLMSVSIEGPQTSKSVLDESHFSRYKEFLYQATTTHIYSYRVVDGTVLSHFELKEAAPIEGIVALPNNNVLVVRGSKVELIDCTFEALIQSQELAGRGPIELLAFSEATSSVILMQGQSTVFGLPVTPTKGKLLQSIGKGSAHKSETYALADIFDGFSKPVVDFRTTAESQLIKANEEYREIEARLDKVLSERDGPSFAELITYLKNPQLDWKAWQASGEVMPPQEQDLVYEETDRNVDRNFIRRVSELAFLPRFKPFLPIGVAVYLLTHPLFPTGEPEFKHLLKSLEVSDAILYRQALVSLSGITPKDLVLGLMSTDEATFLDAALRLQEEFGSQQIFQGVREAFSGLRSATSLGVLIERLSRYPETVGLIGPFVDTMGLLAWDIKHIRRLRIALRQQIDAIDSCYLADAAITDLFSSAGLDITDAAQPASTGVKRARKFGEIKSSDSESLSIPRYSIETLSL